MKILFLFAILTTKLFASDNSPILMMSCESSFKSEPVGLEVYVDQADYCRGNKSFPGFITFYGPEDLIDAKVSVENGKVTVLNEEYQLRTKIISGTRRSSAKLTIFNGPGSVDRIIVSCELARIDC